MSKRIQIAPEPFEAIEFAIGEEEFQAYPVTILAFMEFSSQTRDAAERERKAKANKKLTDGDRDTEVRQAQSDQGAAMFDLFRSTMSEEEYDRFSEFARDPRNGVSSSVLLELIGGLVEASADRPSEPPLPSSTTPEAVAAT